MEAGEGGDLDVQVLLGDRLDPHDTSALLLPAELATDGAEVGSLGIEDGALLLPLDFGLGRREGLATLLGREGEGEGA